MIIDIVTPTYNRDLFLAETLQSVVTQKIAGKINYYIMDGGSTDKTLEIAHSWEKKALIKNSNLTMHIESGKDKGMYDAILKGFNKGSGDVMAWINSDDVYLPNALSVVEEIFQTNPDVDWISGIPTFINTQGAITWATSSIPLKTQSGIARGIYNFKNKSKFCPAIQQDCVFWRRTLWNKLDNTFLNKFCNAKYAGDYFLWREFAKTAKLYHVKCFLSGFRIHQDQLTTNLDGYVNEMGAVELTLRDSMISIFLNVDNFSPSILNNDLLGKAHKQLCSNFGTGYLYWSPSNNKWMKKYD